MDTLLKDGDFYLDERGCPVKIEGANELVQQAVLRLTTRKGAFALDKSLGSELYRLRACGKEKLASLAEAYVAQAVLPVNGLELQKVQCEATAQGVLRLDVYIKLLGEESLITLTV